MTAIKTVEEKIQSNMTKETGIQIHVKKRNGRLEPMNLDKINRCVERACEGLADVSASEIVLDASLQLFNKVSTSEIDKALTLSARSKIEKEPNYAFAAARILANTIYKEVFGEGVDHECFELQYRKSFIINLKKLIKADRLHPKLLDFDLKRLADALCIERDLKFKYLGLQTLYDRYFIHMDGRRMEAPQAFWMRVAMGLAVNEADKEKSAIEFYDIMSSFLYCPSTPTLFNSGTMSPQLSSCYLSTVGDSIDGIFGTIHGQARLSKHAGGLGVDWTPIRGSGAYIKGTNGNSNGVIPWLKIFNDTLVAVNQGGKRKGAGCSYLETWHLDIEAFLDLRKNTGDERQRCHDMNTANWIPDLFMKRVKEDGDWHLFSPSDVPDLHEIFGEAFEAKYVKYEKLATAGELKNFRVLKAKDLWKKMLKALIETGHPWITFKDPSNIRYSNQHVGVVHNSNLCTEIQLHTKSSEYKNAVIVKIGETAVCLAEGTMILTNKGQLPIEQCDGVEIVVPFVSDNNGTPKQRSIRASLIDNGCKEVFRVISSAGVEVEATANHLFMVQRKYGQRRPNRKTNTLPKYEWVRLDELQKGDRLVSPATSVLATHSEVSSLNHDTDFMSAGWMLGDGWQSKGGYGVCFGSEEDEKARDVVVETLSKWHQGAIALPGAVRLNVPKVFSADNGVSSWSSQKHGFIDYVENRFGLTVATAPNKRIPLQIMESSPNQQAAFLAGLYSADGCVMLQRGTSLLVSLTSASRKLLQDVQKLFRSFGIHGRIRTCTVKGREGFSQSILDIRGRENVGAFIQHIGFGLHPRKQADVKRYMMVAERRRTKSAGHRHTTVIEIVPIGIKQVYDLHVPEAHHFIANGIVSHNCNLGSLNLIELLREAKRRVNSSDMCVVMAKFFDLLQKSSGVAIRMLNAVIDENFYPTEEARNANMNNRPVGLGIMGFHDVLHDLDISYESPSAIVLSGDIQENIAYAATLASTLLAKEFGPYPNYKGSLWDQGILPIDTYMTLMKQRGTPIAIQPSLNWGPVREMVALHGMRNSNTMAIAPTATISYIHGCSQSIEPEYSVLHVYSTLSGDFTLVSDAFVKECKKRKLWCPELVNALKQVDGDIAALSLPDDLKHKFKSCFNLDQHKLVECAAERQKWIDMGQSLNLYSNTMSLKFLNDLYFHAWESGLKTTYYLRTQAASKIEKATTSVVKAESTDEEKAACSLNSLLTGESCEACQ